MRQRADASRIGVASLVREAFSGLAQRPARSVLTAVGTALGVGAFVTVLGIVTTANSQISTQFTRLSATQVTVTSPPPSDTVERPVLDRRAERSVERIHGVRAAGVWWRVQAERVSGLPPGLDGDDAGSDVNVVAADAGFWRAVSPRIEVGRVVDAFSERRRVAVLGRSAARALGVGELTTQPVVWLDDEPYVVVGIIRDTKRVDDPVNAVTIPTAAATRHWGPPEQGPRMIVETRLGAAGVVADQVPVAIDPTEQRGVEATAPIEPTLLRNAVSDDLRTLFLALAAVSQLVGAVSIANTNLVAVMERVPEIGLRRTLGARPRHVAAQLLVESAVLGAFGGVSGSLVGVSVTIVVAQLQQWTATLQPLVVIAAPVVGSLVGLAAGLHPALRASRIEPIEALRR